MVFLHILLSSNYLLSIKYLYEKLFWFIFMTEFVKIFNIKEANHFSDIFTYFDIFIKITISPGRLVCSSVLQKICISVKKLFLNCVIATTLLAFSLFVSIFYNSSCHVRLKFQLNRINSSRDKRTLK